MSRTNPDRGGKWGIMGGVFDPIHYGHLILAESARQAYNFDGVLFVPSFDPPHREAKPIASFENRCIMVKLAIEGHDHFSVSDLEKDLASPGYTLAVVDYLQQKHPRTHWHLILGADNITMLDSWHKPEQLIERVPIVVGNRPGYDHDFENSRWYARVKVFIMPMIELSSTEIRRAVKEDRSIRYMLPEDVRRFVENRDLYR
ncbi:MAG: nicotinate (nicotinamide) nucleotide adenylyltransferase [Candidatus Zixiibacteriota bacterium]|nr:MAG: nicotinate (nicotinamide) nucleotide adenylyltransferase [candidate division Zixibacteria bacterium]